MIRRDTFASINVKARMSSSSSVRSKNDRRQYKSFNQAIGDWKYRLIQILILQFEYRHNDKEAAGERTWFALVFVSISFVLLIKQHKIELSSLPSP